VALFPPSFRTPRFLNQDFTPTFTIDEQDNIVSMLRWTEPRTLRFQTAIDCQGTLRIRLIRGEIDGEDVFLRMQRPGSGALLKVTPLNVRRAG
jgi:hypothetical protein